MLPVPANRDVYRLFREGVTMDVKQPDGSTKPERVALIDWSTFRDAPESARGGAGIHESALARAKVEAKLERVLKSSSWRITQPLSMVADAIKTRIPALRRR
jgi:hypothetical protein